MTRVMTVDDDRMILTVLQKILEKQGYEVTPFSDSQPALEADLDAIDVLITDLDMPTRGEVLIREVQETRPALPIIVLSGMVSPDKEAMLLAMGVDKVLSKPFAVDELLGTVARFEADKVRDG